MPTPDEVRADVAAARAELASALAAAPSDAWERKPESGEGEDAWSAREAAQHVIGAEMYFASAVCEACGYDGPESPFADGLELASPEAASAALEQAAAAADSKVQHVTAGDLERSHERMGPLPAIFESWSGHLRDHAAQITAAGA